MLRDVYGNVSGVGNYNQGVIADKVNIEHLHLNETSILSVLKPDFVKDALYNSAARQAKHAAICKANTREDILGKIRSWADSDSPTASRVCWLSGPAGTGKSTVAHTVAKEYKDQERLAATFFFSRTGNVNKIEKLLPTLAHQIAEIPSARKGMEESLKQNGDPSGLALEDQFSTLITINVTVDNLIIIIDGLDECDQNEICELINLICKKKSPFRFLLTSRPVREIEEGFKSNPGDGYDVLSLSLTKSKQDIRNYFDGEFARIGLKVKQSDFESLVEKSEGLFLHAATAIRHIGGRGFAPLLLQGVLDGGHNGLDNLYAQVIKDAKKWPKFDIVMGSIIHLRYSLSVDDLSRILPLLGGVIVSALDGCRSILVIPEGNTPITFYHPLLQEQRSDDPDMALATCHGRLMLGCLDTMTGAVSEGKIESTYALVSWYRHACLFLSHATDGELEKLKEENLKLKEESRKLKGESQKPKEENQWVEKIDLNWVKSWMIAALKYAGLPYLRADTKLPKVPPTGTQDLERKLRLIDGILESVSLGNRHRGMQLLMLEGPELL